MTKSTTSSDPQRALVSFAVWVDGAQVIVQPGQIFASGHPLVKGRESLFGPAFPVEPAPAAPVKKRRR